MTLEVPRRAGALWFVAWATASSVWCLSASPRLGATFDEPTYIAAGLDRWRDGTIGGLMRLGTMPLPVDVVTLPLWLEERWTGERFRIGTDGRGRVIESADLPRALPVARATTLVFWWILLAAGWTLGNQLAGPWGARLAVAFLAVEPSLLAHATLATTDIALTAFLLAFAASLVKYTNKAALYDVSSQGAWGDQGGKLTGRTGRSRRFSFSPWRPALIPGTWFGLALLSKASALVFAPLIALCAFAPRVRSGEWGRSGGTLLRVTAIAIAIAFIYCGSDWRREESFVEWARAWPDGAIATGLRSVADHLPIFSNAGEGLVQQVKHNIRGHDAYLLGREYSRAVWFYFPMVLLIKTSGAILVALLAIVLFRRDALAGNWLVGAAALMVVLSPAFRVQTGVRMILPALALAIIGLAAAIVRAASAARDGGRVRAVAVVLLAWSAIGAWRSWPDALPFANEFWGGREHAYRLVSDSNYDWGQGLPELRRWSEVHGLTSMDVWYWGADPEIASGRWRALDVRAITPAEAADARRLLQGRYLAVSATMLYGSVLTPVTVRDDTDRAAMHTAESLRRFLRARPWSARTGTFFIYDFTPDSTSGVVAPSPHK